MSLLQCDWAASPCSGREQQGTVTGGPSSASRGSGPPTSPRPWGLWPCTPLWLRPVLCWCRWFGIGSHLQRLSPVRTVDGCTRSLPERGRGQACSPPLFGAGETAAGGGEELAQPAQQTGAGATVSPARGGGARGGVTGIARQMPALLFPRAGFWEQAARRREHPDGGTARVARGKPLWQVLGLREPCQDPSGIRGKRARRSRGSQQPHGPQRALRIPSTAQHPGRGGGGCHLSPSPHQRDAFVPRISRAWAPCPYVSQPGAWRGAGRRGTPSLPGDG